MQLGRKIRDLRLLRGMTVQRLADASGLSKGFVSQVENGHTSPSLESLHHLAAALDTPAAWLVLDEPPAARVVRAHERATRPDATMVEVIAASRGAQLELLTVELPIGGRMETAARLGEECVLCLEGSIVLERNGERLEMGVGDACHFDSRHGLALANADGAVARVMIARTPASPNGVNGRVASANGHSNGGVDSPAA
ncbi:MAG TPA: helix-turn-helix domain-containing protein [Candidatus Eisenbacteria bacterium]|nr:helix-turn-helix domain-containing protein [Candidatus Eisenbacteria bacterium]